MFLHYDGHLALRIQAAAIQLCFLKYTHGNLASIERRKYGPVNEYLEQEQQQQAV